MFNEWLLERLKELEWSQADLARASGLTTAAISKYINGRIPDEAALRKLAKALKMPPDLVFEKAGILPPKSDLTPLQRSIMEMVKNLPDNDLSMVEIMLRALSDKKVG